MRPLLAAVALTGAAAAPAAPPAAAASVLPPIGHVWTIVLENSDFLQTFVAGTNGTGTPLSDPYIAQTLPSEGALVVNYFGTGHNSLDNYITMTSGQLPNDQTKGDCSDASILGGGTDPTANGGKGNLTLAADGQWVLPQTGTPAAPDTSKDGCTFPGAVKSIADQFQEAGISWKGYMEDMDATPTGPNAKRTTCQYAGSQPYAGQPTEATLTTPSTTTHVDYYARKHDPFEYYHSFTDQQAYCDAHDVALGYEGTNGPTTAGGTLSGPLATDLASPNPPQYSFITPDLCDDAHDTPCGDGSNTQGGLARANTWLPPVIDAITSSAAYKKDGLIVLTLDEGVGDPTACCGEAKGPNLGPTVDNGSYTATTGVGNVPAPGGGQIGTILLSPFITPGTKDLTGSYNHCSYLRTIEDIFHIGATAAIPGSDRQGHLACAGQTDENVAAPGQVADYGYAGDIWSSTQPGNGLPESPMVWLLPAAGLGAAGWLVRRSTRRRAAA